MPCAFLVGRVASENIQVRDQWFDRSIRRLERYNEMAADWRTRIEDAQIVDKIMSDAIDYRTTAVVAGPELPQVNGIIAKSEVLNGPQETDRMSFEVNSDSPALVISNNYYPGRSATVNGQPAKILRTKHVDGDFRFVWTQRGRT